MMTLTTESFGAALAEHRELRGLHPRDLGRRLSPSVTAQTISNYERGERGPQPDTVFQLERSLELEPGTLSRHLGYVPVGTSDDRAPSLVEVISTTGELEADSREILLATTRTMLRIQHAKGRS